MRLWKREPVMVTAMAQALVALVAAFGLEVSVEEMGAIIAAVSVVVGLIARARVTPA